MDLASLQSFFGWGSIIGMAILSLSIILVIGLRGIVISIHRRLFALSDETLDKMYFNFLAYFKLSIFVFYIIPYFALCMLAR